jgi:hypothetical protein
MNNYLRTGLAYVMYGIGHLFWWMMDHPKRDRFFVPIFYRPSQFLITRSVDVQGTNKGPWMKR